ncbi:hypothetical protein, partial [uncultured Desulfovibrio sp.]|uniref:hypothetical protein n=1 Tax=uncultured Desulfovibrio sp. TaxID=167968 RepID=UPI00272C5B7B
NNRRPPLLFRADCAWILLLQQIHQHVRVGVCLPKQGHEGVAWVLIFSLLTVLRAMRFVFMESVAWRFFPSTFLPLSAQSAFS